MMRGSRIVRFLRQPGSSRQPSFFLTLFIAAAICGSLLLLQLPIARGTAAHAATFQVALTASPAEGSAPLLVQFNATASFGTPTDYNWSFGDGTGYSGTNVSASRPAHLYSTTGSFVAAVTVWEGTSSGRSSIIISVGVGPLTVKVTASVTSGAAPLTVRFSGTPSGGTGTFENLTWRFGDGGEGSGADVSYTYVRPGTFTAVFTAYDSANGSASASVEINVTGASAPSNTVSGGSIFAILLWAIVGFGLGLLVAFLAIRLWTSRPDRVQGPVSLGPAAAGPVAPVPPSGTGETGGPTSASVPPSPGAESSRPDANVLRLSQRIVVHLGSQGRLADDEVATPAFTQGGMAEALHIRQSSLTNVLRRLVSAGVITEDVRHVRGRNRRLKVYRLTPRGESLARELQRRVPGRSPERMASAKVPESLETHPTFR